MRRSVVIAVTIVSIALVLWLVVATLPRGYSDDLARIGQGRAVGVLVYKKDTVESMQLMSMVDSLRDEYAGRVEFILADANTAMGVEFARQYGANLAQLVLFGTQGEKLDVIQEIEDPAPLRRALEQIPPPR